MTTTTEAQVHAEMLRLVAQALRHPDPRAAADALDRAADELDRVELVDLNAGFWGAA